MVLNIIDIVKTIIKGCAQISKVLEDHLFQYFESANKSAIDNKRSKDIVARDPPIINTSDAI